MSGLIEEGTRRDEESGELEKKLEGALRVLIANTTNELIGGIGSEGLEKKLKKAIFAH